MLDARRDEGRSRDYDAEERNEAMGIFVQTGAALAFPPICFVARLANALRPFGGSFRAVPPGKSAPRHAGVFQRFLVREVALPELKEKEAGR